MNWSVLRFVGNASAHRSRSRVWRRSLESTFRPVDLGWNRLSRLHRNALIAVLGTWLSAYFILVANSWMQHPVGYKIVDGEAQRDERLALLSNGFALRAYVHTILAGLIFGSIVMLGVRAGTPARPRGRPVP